MSSSQELDRVQERADKTIAELRRTQAELRVTQVSIVFSYLCKFNALITTIETFSENEPNELLKRFPDLNSREERSVH